jgi:hypothetical protein
VYAIYASPYHKSKMVAYFYNTPQIGGHRKPLVKHLKNDNLKSLLRKFPACRIATAMLCQEFNKKGGKGIHVIPVAAKNTMANWTEAKKRANKAPKDDPILSDPLCQLALMSEHTVVTHNVGIHRDNFGKGDKGGDKIENKVVLLNWSRHGNGRGGAEGFVEWALLDW